MCGRYAAMLLPICIACVQLANANNTLAIAFYDIDLLRDDANPSQPQNIAAVIDSLSLPIIVLLGVQSERGVRDIVSHLKHPMSYLHRDMIYHDRIDFAMLYDGGCVEVESVSNCYASLNILFRYLCNDNLLISLYLARNGKRLPIYHHPATDLTLLWGTLLPHQIKRCHLRDITPHNSDADIAVGNYKGGRQRITNRLAIHNNNSKIINTSSYTYIRPWLLTPNGQHPSPSFHDEHYNPNGYSSRLPLIFLLHW